MSGMGKAKRRLSQSAVLGGMFKAKKNVAGGTFNPGGFAAKKEKAGRRGSLSAFTGITLDKEGKDVDASAPFLLRNKLRSATRVVDALDNLNTAEGEKVSISVKNLQTECRIKKERAERASVGWRFMVFFCIYAVTLTMQRNALRGESVTFGVFNHLMNTRFYSPRTSGTTWPTKDTPPGGCRGFLGEQSSDGCQIPPGELKRYLDLVTVEDVWDWFELHFIPLFYTDTKYNGDPQGPTETMTLNFHLRVMDGFRFTQKRVVPGAVSRNSFAGRCWAYNAGKFRQFAPECYDALSLCSDGTCLIGQEDRSPFGTFVNEEKYKWQEYDVGSKNLGLKENGYFFFFDRFDKNVALQQLAELKADRWVDKATQWLRLDFSMLNADERMFVVLRFLLLFDNTGMITPILVSDVTQVVWYNFSQAIDIVRLLLEICVVAIWVQHVFQPFYEIREIQRTRKLSFSEATHEYFHSKQHSYIMDVLLCFFLAVFILWIIVISDPLRNSITVYQQYMDFGGQPLFLTQIANFERGYFIVNGLCCVLFVLRILQIAKVNPRFSLLSDSLDAMKGRLLNFAIVMFILLVFFTVQAMVMFGDKIPVFTDFGYAFVAVVQILIGSGGASRTSNRSRRGGGSGELRPVDYPDLKAVSPESAWLFYYPFVFMMVFVVINITIAIIGEAYVRVKRQRDPKSDEYQLCPSEARAGKPMPVLQQITKGLKRRLTRCLRKEKNIERKKGEILEMCEKLPAWMDKECCTVADLADAAAPHGFTRESITWLTQRYPVIVNTETSLKELLAQRTPPAPTVKQQLEHVAASVEELVNTQAGIHAKLDLLIRMATL